MLDVETQTYREGYISQDLEASRDYRHGSDLTFAMAVAVVTVRLVPRYAESPCRVNAVAGTGKSQPWG